MRPLHGLFLTKAEGFVLIQKNLNYVDRQLFGRSGHWADAANESAINRKPVVQRYCSRARAKCHFYEGEFSAPAATT